MSLPSLPRLDANAARNGVTRAAAAPPQRLLEAVSPTRLANTTSGMPRIVDDDTDGEASPFPLAYQLARTYNRGVAPSAHQLLAGAGAGARVRPSVVDDALQSPQHKQTRVRIRGAGAATRVPNVEPSDATPTKSLKYAPSGGGGSPRVPRESSQPRGLSLLQPQPQTQTSPELAPASLPREAQQQQQAPWTQPARKLPPKRQPARWSRTREPPPYAVADGLQQAAATGVDPSARQQRRPEGSEHSSTSPSTCMQPTTCMHLSTTCMNLMRPRAQSIRVRRNLAHASITSRMHP